MVIIMGGFAAHAAFGKEVLERNADIMPAAAIKKHLGVFGVGCQGPDLFLYNILMLISSKEKNLGIRMHNEGSSRYFANLMQAVSESLDVQAVEVGMSYLYGALAHYTLDSMIHPYVYAKIGYDAASPYSKKATNGLHHRLESAMDAKIIAAKEKKLPSKYSAAESQQMEKQEKKLLAAYLSKAVSRSYQIKLKEENVFASLKMMRIITSGFFMASSAQRKKLQKLEWPFCEDYGLSNFMVTDDLVQKKKVMNLEKCTWHNPWDKKIASSASVWEIFGQAADKYREYCFLLKDALPSYKDGFYAIQGEADGMDGRKKKIAQAARGLGNLSYDTGLSL
ncbi:hypothetical protein D7V86_13035 [bacterium D16-51]|nr:hypothetical protein D7V96_23620 [bacterium D16-59]RKI59276.1 hypothetical protein D7V86_13035 [bacterium D16-51]